MDEIDTKSIKPVQVAVCLFGENDHKSASSYLENAKDRDVEGLMKDLANYKLQLEAKDSAYKQALLKVEHYQKIAEELSTLLKQSEVDREKYVEQFTKARNYVDELESKVREMANQLLENGKIRKQLLHVLNELKAAQEELLRMETELAAARDLQLKAMTQAELLQSAYSMEKGKAEELLRHVKELNEAILMSNLASIEFEKEKCKILCEKEAEIELAIATAAQAQKQLEGLNKKLQMAEEMENEFLAKSVFVDVLQLELKQSTELLSSSDKATSDASNVLRQLKADMEVKEIENSDQALHIEALETELSLLKQELKNSNEEIGCLKSDFERLTDELQKAKTEIVDVRERETEAQVEIAMLKSELHRGRSKIAAAEAAEARAESVKSGLYLAVQQLAVEAEKAKKESKKLKEGAADNPIRESESVDNSSQDVELPQLDQVTDTQVTISFKEYEILIKNAQKANQNPVSPADYDSNESENLRKELEVAMVKIGEFRNRAEQAVTRAEAAEKAKAEVVTRAKAAEKAKAAIEDQLRKWRKQKQKRRAAFDSLKQFSSSSTHQNKFPTYEEIPAHYQPLGKVLNMKF